MGTRNPGFRMDFDVPHRGSGAVDVGRTCRV